jgi:hypothetical protein
MSETRNCAAEPHNQWITKKSGRREERILILPLSCIFVNPENRIAILGREYLEWFQAAREARGRAAGGGPGLRKGLEGSADFA